MHSLDSAVFGNIISAEQRNSNPTNYRPCARGDITNGWVADRWIRQNGITAHHGYMVGLFI